MKRKLIIDGNAIYEIDEECMKKRQKELEEKEKQEQNIANKHKKRTE